MKRIFTAILALLIFAPTCLAAINQPLEEFYVKAQVNEVNETKIQIDKMSPYYDPTAKEP